MFIKCKLFVLGGREGICKFESFEGKLYIQKEVGRMRLFTSEGYQ